MFIIKPRFVSIDSSVLNGWAADAYSHDRARVKASREAFKELFDDGWIPVLCWHHFEEMVRHGDDKVVADRIALLRSFPQVAWIRSYAASDELGSMVDILAAEIDCIVSRRSVDTADTQEIVRQGILGFGKPDDIETLSMWREIRPLLRQRINRQREIASIAHIETQSTGDTRLDSLVNARLRPLEEVQQLFRRQAEALTTALDTRGDDRLNDPAATADAFFAQAYADQLEMRSRHAPALEMLLGQFGLSASDFGAEATLEDFKDLARFRRKVEVAARNLPHSLPEIWLAVRNSQIPSRRIQAEIRIARSSATSASGSDLGDDYLACLTPYVDATVLDKRTHEYLSQRARRDSNFSALIGQIVRVTNYEGLPQTLAAGAPVREH